MSFSHCQVCLTPTTFLERSGRAFPQKTAIQLPERTFTYSDLLTRSRQLSSLLREIGVRHGDCVGLLSHNSHQMIEAHYGIPGAGGIIVALNPWLSVEDLLKQVRFCNIRVLLIQDGLTTRLSGLLTEMEQHGVVVVLNTESSDHGKNRIHLESVLADYDSERPLDAGIQSENDPVAINFTSGTTGQPKGVVYSHRAAYLHALGQVMMYGLSAESRYLWSLPMFHVNGWGHMWAAVVIGARQIVTDNSKTVESAELQRWISDYSVTHMAGAPRLVRLLGEADSEVILPRGLTVMTGGAAPTPDLIGAMEKRGVRLIHQYGLNETCGPFVVCEEQDGWRDLSFGDRAANRLRQGVAAIHAGNGLRVVDEAGNDVAWDGREQGEVMMRGNTLALGYFNNPAATAKAFRDGWFHSGDVAVVHCDGYIEIRDRIKDLIFVNTAYGWENISSIEIENEISRCEGVLDVAVIGIRDDDDGTSIVACYESKPGYSIGSAHLQSFCRKRLPAHKVPGCFLEMVLPKTATGKVRKNVLEADVLAKLAPEPVE